MRLKTSLLLVFALAFAGWAAAQTGGKYSASPTDQDYRLVVVEPKEGATVTGKDVTIVLGLPAVPEGQPPAQSTEDPKRRDMNTPTFQVWVDGKDYGNIPAGQNIFALRDLGYGPHKITVAAKNVAGELVDRKEISITTVEAKAESGSTSSAMTSATSEQTTTRQTTTQREERTQPMTAAQAPEPAPAPKRTADYTSDSDQLPKTASNYPLAAIAGLGLLGVGIALRRKF